MNEANPKVYKAAVGVDGTRCRSCGSRCVRHRCWRCGAQGIGRTQCWCRRIPVQCVVSFWPPSVRLPF